MTVYSDGYSALITRTYSNKSDTYRYYAGVTKADCKRGYGDFKVREALDESWRKDGVFSLKSSTTVADSIMTVICEAGKIVDNRSRPASKPTPAKPI